jgi:hypothetical protein
MFQSPFCAATEDRQAAGVVTVPRLWLGWPSELSLHQLAPTLLYAQPKFKSVPYRTSTQCILNRRLRQK